MKFHLVTYQAEGSPEMCQRLDEVLGTGYKVITWAASPGIGWYVIEAEDSAGLIFEHLLDEIGSHECELKLFVTEIAGGWAGCGDYDAVLAIEAVVPRG